MPDILLIDTHSGVKTALEAAGCRSMDWGSFGHPMAGGGPEVFRDPREYKVVIHDALNATLNRRDERSNVPITAGVLFGGDPAFDLLSCFSFAYQRHDLFDQFVRRGGILIVFAGAEERIPLPPPRSPGHSDPRVQVFLFGGSQFAGSARGFGETHWP